MNLVYSDDKILPPIYVESTFSPTHCALNQVKIYLYVEHPLFVSFAGGFIPHDPIKLTDGGYYVNDDGYLSYVREDSSTESNNSANLSNISLSEY